VSSQSIDESVIFLSVRQIVFHHLQFVADLSEVQDECLNVVIVHIHQYESKLAKKFKLFVSSMNSIFSLQCLSQFSSILFIFIDSAFDHLSDH